MTSEDIKHKILSLSNTNVSHITSLEGSVPVRQTLKPGFLPALKTQSHFSYSQLKLNVNRNLLRFISRDRSGGGMAGGWGWGRVACGYILCNARR